MKIVIGLGNIGAGYAHTYHNLGFLTAECLAARLNAAFNKRECNALTAHTEVDGERVIIAKPETMMNLSGTAAQGLVSYYKCALSDLIVLVDDIDLEKGSVRYRASGSAGTHNGMRDIVLKLGDGFKRIRIGAGRPREGRDLASYVLSSIPAAERPVFVAAIEQAADKTLAVIRNNA